MSNWNFNLENAGGGGDINYNLQFTNNWSFNNGFGYHITSLSASMLRGGPAFMLPPSTNGYAGFRTNQRRQLSFNSQFSFTDGREDSQKRRNYNVGMTYRPFNTLMLTLTPSYSIYENNTQYVRTINPGDNENRYLLARLKQKTVAMSLRVNYTITPDLSLQFWGQPFFASGNYDAFKRVTNPRASEYQQRFYTYSPSQIHFNEQDRTYHVNEGNQENHAYSFRNPDFNVIQFLGNMVVRWEYRPGSTLFMVWSQTRDHFHDNGMFDLHHDAGQLLDIKPHNVFMLKFTYRFGA